MSFDAIIVLGAAVWPGGEPSPTLRRRTLAGIAHFKRLTEQGHRPLIVFSGGLGQNPPSEAEVMATLAQAEGVPRESIVLEDKSTNTVENLAYSARLLRETFPNGPRLLIVTDAYHATRALMIATTLGLEAEAAPVPRPRDSPRLRWFGMALRDRLATPLSRLRARKLR